MIDIGGIGCPEGKYSQLLATGVVNNSETMENSEAK
jgi:hypothetical protein